MTTINVNTAYQICLTQAQAHYENFPTATRLINKKHRLATAAIYSFARRADDIADERDSDTHTRPQQLDAYQTMLDNVYRGTTCNDATFIALADTIQNYDLPQQPFNDLLTAFRTDIDKTRYANFDELQEYCHHSADPIGELILRLHGLYNDITTPASNNICSALQLINFIQDIDEDYQQRDRIYIPLDEMQQYHIEEQHIANRVNSPQMQDLVNTQLTRATNMLNDGIILLSSLNGRLKLTVNMTIRSGLRIADKLRLRQNPFSRPTLNKKDWLLIILHSLYFRPNTQHAKLHS